MHRNAHARYAEAKRASASAVPFAWIRIVRRGAIGSIEHRYHDQARGLGCGTIVGWSHGSRAPYSSAAKRNLCRAAIGLCRSYCTEHQDRRPRGSTLQKTLDDIIQRVAQRAGIFFLLETAGEHQQLVAEWGPRVTEQALKLGREVEESEQQGDVRIHGFPTFVWFLRRAKAGILRRAH